MEFKTRPVPVYAYQFSGLQDSVLFQFMEDQMVNYVTTPPDGLLVKTMHGWSEVGHGHWIVNWNTEFNPLIQVYSDEAFCRKFQTA